MVQSLAVSADYQKTFGGEEAFFGYGALLLTLTLASAWTFMIFNNFYWPSTRTVSFM